MGNQGEKEKNRGKTGLPLSEVRGLRSAFQSRWYEVRRLRSAIRDLRSAVRGPLSVVLRSGVRGLWSVVRGL